MAIWRPLDRVLNPLLQAIRQVPLMGWLPLLGLWFGTGQGTELIVVSLSAFFPTLLNSYEKASPMSSGASSRSGASMASPVAALPPDPAACGDAADPHRR
jgi:hypothetical protein